MAAMSMKNEKTYSMNDFGGPIKLGGTSTSEFEKNLWYHVAHYVNAKDHSFSLFCLHPTHCPNRIVNDGSGNFALENQRFLKIDVS